MLLPFALWPFYPFPFPRAKRAGAIFGSSEKFESELPCGARSNPLAGTFAFASFLPGYTHPRQKTFSTPCRDSAPAAR